MTDESLRRVIDAITAGNDAAREAVAAIDGLTAGVMDRVSDRPDLWDELSAAVETDQRMTAERYAALGRLNDAIGVRLVMEPNN